MLSEILGQYPQAAYHGFITVFQAGWQYTSRVVPGLGDHLQPIEDAIHGDLILTLLGCTVEQASKFNVLTLLGHGVKQGGINLRNPVAVAVAAWLWQSSVKATVVLMNSLLEKSGLYTVEHRECVKEVQRKNEKKRMETEKAEVQRQMVAIRGKL